MWPFKKKLSDLLKPHRVNIHGVIFHLKKLSPLDYVTGARVLQSSFDTYKTSTEKQQLEILSTNMDKIKEHYIDVFMASVVEPKLSRKKDVPDTMWVENLFSDWDLINELYMTIIELTYGKKKLKQLMSQGTSS